MSTARFNPAHAPTAAAFITCIGAALAHAQPANESPPPVREEMVEHAQALRPFVRSEIATAFLDAVPELPRLGEPRVIYYKRDTREAMTRRRARALNETEREGFERREIDERSYYYTMYGTPLAFVRPLDLLGRAGMESLDGARVVDFGFGSVGQLRLMAANGAAVHGVEVSEFLRALYSEADDAGRVARAKSAGVGTGGTVKLHFGRWPAQDSIVRDVGGGFDAFISKNTLKNGYIHPAEEVDPRMLVHLGVDDETFVRSVFNALDAGGWFMIYNLCPAQSTERYLPWADGRSPFSRELLEATGFTVLAYNEDDSGAAREMAAILGWDETVDLEADLFGIYTLARKP